MGSLLRRWFLSLMVAVVVALVGAIPLANASGFSRQLITVQNPSETPLVYVCGFILFGLTLALLGPITQGISALIYHLARTNDRPTPLAAATMIGSGTLCVLYSLYLSWMSSASGPVNQIRNQMQDVMKTVNANGVSFNMNLPAEALGGSGSGSGAMILTVLVFVLGVALIALGVWASLPVAPPLKTPIPAADAVSL